MISSYIGKTVNFNTKAPSILGVNRKNVQIVAVLDLDTAKLYQDVVAMHRQMRSVIEDLAPLPSAYNYVKIKYANGRDVEILGIPWIDTASIEVVSEQELVVRVKKKTANTEELIRTALLQNGIDDFTIETV